MGTPVSIRLFVYGTLKRGGRYHEQYCARATNIEAASLDGQLYQFSADYPTLEIPPENVLAWGSDDPVADARVQRAYELAAPHALARPTGSWRTIQGELITLPDAGTDLPPIDVLEEFDPARAQNLYRRCLAWVQTSTAIVPAWLYVAAAGALDRSSRLDSGQWSPRA